MMSLCGEAGDQDFGGCGGEGGGVMMFADPVAGIAEAVGEAGEPDRFLKRSRSVAVVAEGSLVEDAEADVGMHDPL